MNDSAVASVSWSEIFDADLSSLREWVGSRVLDVEQDLYARALIAYHHSDLTELESTLHLLTQPRKSEGLTRALQALVRSRISLRCLPIPLSDARARRDELEQVEGELKGEAQFLAGLICSHVPEAGEAGGYFLCARDFLARMGAHRKARRAEINELSHRSRQDLGRNVFIAEYFRLYWQSRRARETENAGIAALNLSFSFQRMGAWGVALRYARKAEQLGAESGWHNLNHYRALLQSLELLSKMGFAKEAELLEEECTSAPFPEILSALRNLKLEYRTGVPKFYADDPVLPPEWASKFSGPRGPVFTPLQEKLVHLLSAGPKTKPEMIRALFPEPADQESLGHRLDQVILSIRKQLPGFVAFSGGKYSLVPGKRKP